MNTVLVKRGMQGAAKLSDQVPSVACTRFYTCSRPRDSCRAFTRILLLPVPLNAASIHARMMHVNVYLGPFRLPEIAQNYVLDTDMSGCESLATEGGCIVLKSLAACDM